MNKIIVGQSASLKKIITDEDIFTYAKVSCDYNPIHLDADVAAKGPFGRRIAHGLISVGLISAVIGTKMPGEGTIYLGQNIRFLKPVYIGDEITATCEVSEVINDIKGIYRLRTVCMNQNDELVIDGEAVVKYI